MLEKFANSIGPTMGPSPKLMALSAGVPLTVNVAAGTRSSTGARFRKWTVSVPPANSSVLIPSPGPGPGV